MQGESNIENHPDFREYLQAWIYNETKKQVVINDKKLLNEKLENCPPGDNKILNKIKPRDLKK